MAVDESTGGPDDPIRSHGSFLFADLAGFTALTEAHGDAEAVRIAKRLENCIRGLLPAFGAREVKTIGDEVMVRVEEADQAIRLGLRIVEELAEHGSPPVRVGIHTGAALEVDGDWFGATINLASRVSNAARVGEVLVTESTYVECGAMAEVEFQARGARRFRHIPEPVPVYGARAGPPSALEVDPVCRMAVDPDRAAGTRHHRGRVFHFCSERCARAFDANPKRFIAASPAARAARAGFRIHLRTFLLVNAALIAAWAVRTATDGGGEPWFLLVLLPWTVGLFVHYRLVRRAL